MMLLKQESRDGYECSPESTEQKYCV